MGVRPLVLLNGRYMLGKPFFLSCLLLALVSPLPAQSLTLSLEIGSEAPNYVFFRPTSVAVDERGRIAVLDAGDKTVRVYSPRGEFLFNFGRAGSGPGELSFPVRLSASHDGWEVVDPRLGRVIRFNTSGAHLDTRVLPTPDGLVLTRLVALRHGYSLATTIYRASPGYAEHDPNIRILLVSRPSRIVTDTLATFEQGAGIWSVPGKPAPWGLVPLPWLGAGGTAAVSGDSLLLIGNGTTGVLTFYSVTPGGLREISSANLGIRATPAPRSRVRIVEDSIRQAQKNRSIRVTAPSTMFPLGGDSFFDSAGNSWIELNTSGPIQSWRRISPGARTWTTVNLPRAFRLKAVRGANLYGIATDELGVQTIRVYTLR